MRHVLLIIPLTLTACVAQAPPFNALAGSEWRFTEIDGEKPASDKAALSFGDDRISGTAGCNRMGGPWRVENDRLIAGPFAETRMFCGGKVGEQEQAIGALLVSAPGIALEGGRLELASRGHSARLERTDTE